LALWRAAAGLQLPALGLHGDAQVLDFVAINGAATQHHLEAVVVLGVVAARDLDAAVAQRVGSKVQHGGGDHAHINDGDAGVLQAGHQGFDQSGSAQATVAANGDRGFPLGHGDGAKRPAQAARNVFVDGRRHDAADVVGFEDAGGELHVFSLCKVVGSKG
jgi:hypothetical protein